MFFYKLSKLGWKIFDELMSELKRKVAKAKTFLTAGAIAIILFLIFLAIR
jgi:hypothetical protein